MSPLLARFCRTSAVRQVVGYLRCSGRAVDLVVTAALDPKPLSVEASSCEATEPQLSGRQAYYSMTSSARASSMGGTSRLSALAVFMLMTNSNGGLQHRQIAGPLAPKNTT